MAMARIGVRAGERLGEAWNLVRQRQTLTGDPNRIRSGDKSAALRTLVALRGALACGISPALQAELDKIEWIDIGGSKRIMKGEVTVRLFKLVMEGYGFAGHNADELKAILADPKQERNALTYVSLFDGREFCRRLSSLKGTKVSVQTEADWEAMRAETKADWEMADSPVDVDIWNWTETPNSDVTFVICNPYMFRSYQYPGFRFENIALRIVEHVAA